MQFIEKSEKSVQKISAISMPIYEVWILQTAKPKESKMKQQKLNSTILVIVLSVSMFFFCQFAFAATYSVSTSANFKNWATNAQPGDVIIVTPGTYENWGEINLTADGTESQPITYKANSSGDVIFKDTMALRVRGDWIILENFDFNGVGSANPDYLISVGNSYGSRITKCKFYSCGSLSKIWKSNIQLLTGAKSVKIQHCLFDSSISYMIGADVQWDQDWPKDIQIDHNTFQNSSSDCAIQTASGKYNNGLEETRYIVEYNTFKNLSASKEVICNKSSSNVYKFNTFQDLPVGKLSLRKGHDCTIESNTFTNCYGIRVNGKKHKIINNILYNNAQAFILVYGNIEEYSGTGSTGVSYVAAKDCIIAHNTAIASSGQNIMNSHNYGYELSTILPSGNKIANNIFVADHDKFIVSSLSNNAIDTNIFCAIDSQKPAGTLGTNYITEDPKFTGSGLNSRLSSGSPAIDKGITIPGLSISTDLEGTTRPQGTSNDIGADEFVTPVLAPKNLRGNQ